MTDQPTGSALASTSQDCGDSRSDVRPLLVLLDIGQSPQPDMEAEFRHVLGANCDILTLGALDHLDRNEIMRHAPVDGDDTLFANLPPDGLPVLISRRLVVDGLRRRIENLKHVNAPVRILCCTGGFPEVEASGILMVSDLIANTVRDKVPAGSKLGVFVPHKNQALETVKQWSQAGYEVSVVPLLPEAPDDVIEAAANRMCDLTPDAVLYDCMAYSHKLQSKAQAIYSTTEFLAVSAAAHFASRLLGIKKT